MRKTQTAQATMAPITRSIRRTAACLVATLAAVAGAADEERMNRGHDPFSQVSNALAACPPPRGPMQTPAEWRAEAHSRIERGTSCWMEGRCRLHNAYLYDAEIAESVQRRLASLAPRLPWAQQSSLWFMLQRRVVYVQGCVAPGFDRLQLLRELEKTADVETVVDQTFVNEAGQAPPYAVAASSAAEAPPPPAPAPQR